MIGTIEPEHTTPCDINIIGEYKLSGELWQVKPLLITGGVKCRWVVSALQEAGLEVVGTRTKKRTREDKEETKAIMGLSGEDSAHMIDDMTPRPMCVMLREARADIMLSGCPARLTVRRVPCPQYAYAAVRLVSDELPEPDGGYRLTPCTSPFPRPISAAPSMRRLSRPPIHCARRSCVPERGLTPVCRPHIPEPGDRFHPICANFRSPGPKPARWRASALGKRLPCH